MSEYEPPTRIVLEWVWGGWILRVESKNNARRHVAQTHERVLRIVQDALEGNPPEKEEP